MNFPNLIEFFVCFKVLLRNKYFILLRRTGKLVSLTFLWPAIAIRKAEVEPHTDVGEKAFQYSVIWISIWSFHVAFHPVDASVSWAVAFRAATIGRTDLDETLAERSVNAALLAPKLLS